MSRVLIIGGGFAGLNAAKGLGGIAGIEVKAERSEIVVAPDRDIYSVQNMPVASGGTATEVLQSVPELEVDINGEVSLRGAAPQIYLNGRPAPMQGESLAQFLQQFPADQIDRIEVIANPSARFQAEGAGGIVNIVLKKDVDLGLHGNAFVNGGMGAWELALRFSNVDLTDGSLATGVRGGTIDVLTLGLNWYANSNYRCMLDLSRADVNTDDPALGQGGVSNIIQLRMQVAF